MRHFFELFDDKKAVVIMSAVFAVFLAVLYVVVPDIRMLSDVRKEKVLDARDLSVTGFEDGKKSWEISSKRLSAGRGNEVIEFDDVFSGNVYKKGRLIIKDIRAQKVVVTRYNDRIEAFGSTAEPRPLEARVDIAHASTTEVLREPSKGFSRILAFHLDYRSNIKRSTADNVSVFDRKYSARAGKVEADHERNVAMMTKSPYVKAGDHIISSTTMESYYRRDLLQGTGEVNVRITKKKMVTSIRADGLLFSTKDYSGAMNGGVLLTQKGKIASSEALSFDDKRGTATLRSHVRVYIRKGSDILKESSIEKIKNIEAKKVLRDGVLLNSDSLRVSTRSGDALAEGSVLLLQKNKRAKADRAFYDEKTETITMTGNVHIEKEGEWIKTKKVIVSVNKETFEAVGDVETHFRLKK